MVKNVRLQAIDYLNAISAQFPGAKTELAYREGDAWQLLVAVVLSARATDKKVNEITPKLFAEFSDVYAFSKANPSRVESLIRQIGFFRAKSKNLCAAAKMVVNVYGGNVPGHRLDLEKIPGVGPKSAGVILSNAFGVPAIPVDTHVSRVSYRLGITKEKDPNKIEVDLQKLWPKYRWIEAHQVFVLHGRRICIGRKPLCSICVVNQTCKRVGVTVSG